MAKARRTFTPEFKVQAVKLVTEQGKSIAEVARDLDLGESLLRSWKQALAAERRPGLPRPGQPARPGGGAAPPPRREQAAPDGARHPEKSDGLLRQGVVMRYGLHRGPSRAMAGPADVPGPGRLPRRLLRLAGTAGEPPGAAARGPGRRHQGRPRRGQGPLRQPADPRRAGRAGRGLLREHRGQADARARDRRQDEAEVPRARPTRTTTAPWPRTSWTGSSSRRRPNQVWTADITYIPTREGWLYLAAVEDLLLAADRRLVDGRADRQPAGGRRPGDGRRPRLPGPGWWPTRTAAPPCVCTWPAATSTSPAPRPGAGCA